MIKSHSNIIKFSFLSACVLRARWLKPALEFWKLSELFSFPFESTSSNWQASDGAALTLLCVILFTCIVTAWASFLRRLALVSRPPSWPAKDNATPGSFLPPSSLFGTLTKASSYSGECPPPLFILSQDQIRLSPVGHAGRLSLCGRGKKQQAF